MSASHELSLPLSEFDRKAHKLVQSLWIDWMDLVQASGRDERSAVVQRALSNIRTLELAGEPVNAPQIQSCCCELERTLQTLLDSQSSLSAELLERVYHLTFDLTDAIRAVADRYGSSASMRNSPDAKRDGNG